LFTRSNDPRRDEADLVFTNFRYNVRVFNYKEFMMRILGEVVA